MSLIYYSAVFLFICLAHQQQVRPNDVWTCFACSYFIYKKIEHVSFLVLAHLSWKLKWTFLSPVFSLFLWPWNFDIISSKLLGQFQPT